MGYCKIGCLLCEQNIDACEKKILVTCSVCGERTIIRHPRETPPFLCAKCKKEYAYETITHTLLQHSSTDAVSIALDTMTYHNANICGVEFFYLICGSLLTAYNNAEKNIALEKQLNRARELTQHTTGGSCSLWTSYGTSHAASTFISMLVDIYGMSSFKRTLPQHLLFKSLGSVVESYRVHAGPRCCRRNAIIILLSTIAFAQKYFNASMTLPDNPSCSFDNFTRTCQQTTCFFYPAPMPHVFPIPIQDLILP